ncbi:hypothetical protein [Sodalis-like endosymbiont of Proechinophthirus fluctus]|nr:hypothetical protein [Sodalis-like endosymbiont of Proechinophthirus fluctus]
MAGVQRLADIQKHEADLERIQRRLVIAKEFLPLFALALHET